MELGKHTYLLLGILALELIIAGFYIVGAFAACTSLALEGGDEDEDNCL